VTTPSSTLPAAGCYTYVETIPSTPTSQKSTTTPGDPSETIFVAPYTPTVTTTASAHSAQPGATVHDGIDVSGLHGADSTVDWTLLGPVAAVGGGCRTVSWAGAAHAGNGTVTVHDDGAYNTADVKLTTAGCYTFVEQLAATATTTAAHTDPGDPAETLLVQAPAGGGSSSSGGGSSSSGGGSSGSHGGGSSGTAGGGSGSGGSGGGAGASNSAGAGGVNGGGDNGGGANGASTASTGTPVALLSSLGLLALLGGLMLAWLARRQPGARHAHGRS
jgi:hypothetical protein